MGKLSDSHCHLGVTCDTATVDRMAAKLNAQDHHNEFHIMSTYGTDLALLDQLLDSLEKPAVVPYFGVHPWYSHLFSTVPRRERETDTDYKHRHYALVLQPPPTDQLLEVLPVPVYIDKHLSTICSLIEKHARLSIGIGEIGLDKVFRVPVTGYYGCPSNKEDGEKLSSSRVRMEHQVAVFEKQLQLANKVRKPVSVHCVKAHQALYDTTVRYPDIPSVILHSYSGSVDQARMWIRHYGTSTRCKLYFSFSNWINGADSKIDLLTQLLGYLADDRVLLETDVSVDSWWLDRTEEYYGHLDGIYHKVCEIKSWDPEAAHKTLQQNMLQSIG